MLYSSTDQHGGHAQRERSGSARFLWAPRGPIGYDTTRTCKRQNEEGKKNQSNFKEINKFEMKTYLNSILLPVCWRIGCVDAAQVYIKPFSDIAWRIHQHLCVLWKV